MMEEYLKKYGLSKSNKIEFAKRNLVIGKNGSGKTRFLKAYRDFCLGQYKNIIYIYFPALSAKYEEKFEKIDVDSALSDIVENAEDMSYDEFVETFQYTGASFVEHYIKDLNARGKQKKDKAEKILYHIQRNIKKFLNMELLIDQLKEKANLKFEDGRQGELQRALTEMSPGEINLFYISLFLAIALDKRKYILIIDEPELHIHPSVLIQFYKELKNRSCMDVIWIATHSPLLLQEFSFEEIILIVKSKIQSRNSRLYANILNEMLGERQKAVSELFRSLDEWDFCNYLAECFENPTVVSEANKTDEQALRFREYCSSLRRNNLYILDWGAGSGRLGKCMQLIEENHSDKLEYEYEIYEPHIDDSDRDKQFVTYRNIDDIKKKYNCVVLMNVLHEIDVKEWIELFRNIWKCLKSDGVLIFAEAKVLSLGEQPYCDNGYLVLGEKQIKTLFQAENKNSGITAFHIDLKKEEKSEFIVIPANELQNISWESIRAALDSLSAETFLNLKNMDAERISCAHENKKPSFTYRKYAFMAQQYINTVLALKRIPRIAKRIILESGEAAYKLEL